MDRSLAIRPPAVQSLGIEVTDIPAEEFSKMLKSPTVKLVVGLEKEEYIVHQALVCHLVPFFAKSFAAAFPVHPVGSKLCINLPDEDPITIAPFVGWVYRGADALDAVRYNFMEMIEMYLLADKWGIPKIQSAMQAKLSFYITMGVSMAEDPFTAIAEFRRENEKRISHHTQLREQLASDLVEALGDDPQGDKLKMLCGASHNMAADLAMAFRSKVPVSARSSDSVFDANLVNMTEEQYMATIRQYMGDTPF